MDGGYCSGCFLPSAWLGFDHQNNAQFTDFNCWIVTFISTSDVNGLGCVDFQSADRLVGWHRFDVGAVWYLFGNFKKAGPQQNQPKWCLDSMNKQSLALLFYVLLVASANIYLWVGIVQGGSALRSGRITGLIIMLAIGALFSDKFGRNQYAPIFIRAGSLIGMTVLFLILYAQ